MKKYKIFIVLAWLILVITSCEKFLETKSLSNFTEKTIFTNLDFATKEVYGIYANFTDTYLWGQYLFYAKCDNDIEWDFYYNNGSYNDLAHYAANDANSILKRIWDLLYQTIEKANLCIDNIPESPLWEGEYANAAKQLYGEAVCLRAYCYSLLVSCWGDVPFVIKSTKSGDEFIIPKTDRDSIYEYMIQNLADVEEYVPWMTTTQTTERVNKAFVKGLRARMALAYAGYSLRNKTFETRRGRYWEDYYKIANQECREIMESGKHQLNPDFGGIFKSLHAYKQDLSYREDLFEIAFGRLYSGRAEIGMYFNTNAKYGNVNPYIYAAPHFYYTFDRSDTRRNIAIELYNYQDKNSPGMQVIPSAYRIGHGKWRRNWITPNMGGDYQNSPYNGVNFPLMRYADVILMLAESENEINGTTQSAKDALSLIRQRAFPAALWASKVNHYVDSVSVSKESFFNAIVNERAWEFSGEMLRKDDLIRWNLLGTKITELRVECQKFFNNDPKYSNVPNCLFWKYKTDNETMDILNPDNRLPSNPIAGYTRTYVFSGLSQAAKDTFFGFFNTVANGYNLTKNNHLYPISLEIITSSNGILTNDQIP